MKPSQKSELIEIIDNYDIISTYNNSEDKTLINGEILIINNDIFAEKEKNERSTLSKNMNTIDEDNKNNILSVHRSLLDEEIKLEASQRNILDEGIKPETLPGDYFPIFQKELANNYDITIMESEPDITDIRILHFIKFCIKNKLFDDTFFDYNNVFSIIATRLNSTFNIIRDKKDVIDKENFISFFKHTYKYKKDIAFVYDTFDKDNKNFITWNEFCDFFLPFVRNVTM